MQPQPWLSILLPLFNARETLPYALNSVLKCQASDIEFVLVDDGSEDGSGGIADLFASRDSRVRVIHTQHRGLVEALNTGLETARGEWILRMDADDIAHPSRVQYYREYITVHPEVDIWRSLIRYFPRRDLKEGLLYYEQWVNSICTHEEIIRDLFVECPIPHPTLACRRKDVLEVGGYYDNGLPEDYHLIIRFWERGKLFRKIPKYLLFWRDWNQRLSRIDVRYGIDRFMVLKVAVLKRTLIGDRKVMVSAAGPVGKAFARELLAQGIRIAAFLEVDPKKIGNRVYGVPVLPVEKAQEVDNVVILHAVGQKGERQKGRDLYISWGLTEGKDFICVS